MTPERRKCAVRKVPQKTSIARQRLARHVSAATDKHAITLTLGVSELYSVRPEVMEGEHNHSGNPKQ
jgi:hypothetical protein